MTLTHFLIFSFATWRLSSMLVQEDGPFFMFRRLRERIGIQHDEDGKVFMIPETFLAGLLSCIWCTSVWVAGVLVILWYVAPAIALGIGLWLGISGVAILVDSLR